MNEVLLPRLDSEIEQSDSFGIGALETRRGNLPMCGLGYQTVIRGLAVRTEITQAFYNPFDQPIEATYFFPIEGMMAVTDCMMMVGDRVIRADLQERAAARQRYQDALRRGHRAALLEDQYSIAGVDDEAARRKIIDTSNESRVLSRFTAYVAVDESEVVNQTGSVDRVVQPVEFPEGWQMGRLPAIPPELRISTIESATNAKDISRGLVGGESADSILREYTDSASDSCELGSASDCFGLGIPAGDGVSDEFQAPKMQGTPAYMMPRRNGMTRSRMTPLDPMGRVPSGDVNSPLERLIGMVLAEAARLRSTKIIFKKTGDSILVQHLIDGILDERDRLPLRMWRAIVELLKTLPANFAQHGKVWEGDFSPENSAEYQRIVSSNGNAASYERMTIRIEPDDTIEIVLGNFRNG